MADNLSPKTHRQIEQRLQRAFAAMAAAEIPLSVIARSLNRYVIELWKEEEPNTPET